MSEFFKPPRGASLFVSLFVSGADQVQVLGDLSEEYQQRVARSGEAAARGWYRWEALRNAWAFCRRDIRQAPIRLILISLVWAYGWMVLGNIMPRLLLLLPNGWWFRGHYPEWFNAIVVVLNLASPAILGYLTGFLMPRKEGALAVAFAATYSVLVAGFTVFFLHQAVAQGKIRQYSVERGFWLIFALDWIWVISAFAAGALARGRRRQRLASPGRRVVTT